MSESILSANAALQIRADQAAQEIATSLNLEGDLWVVRNRGIHTWAFADGESSDLDSPTTVIKLARHDDPYATLEQERRDDAIRRGLIEAGAPLVPLIIGPMVVGKEFTATATEYLPGILQKNAGYTDHYDLGAAVGSSHVASMSRPDIAAKAVPFDPLHARRALLPSLIEYQAQANISTEFIETVYLPALARGDKAVDTIMNIMADEAIPEVVVYPDAGSSNARRSRNGEMKLLDFEPMRGSDEYSLGRPFGQWKQHFNCSPEQVSKFGDGYLSTAPRPINKRILELSLLVSKISYASCSLDQLIEAVSNGYEPNAWAVEESTRRLRNLNTPNFPWRSQDEWLRTRASQRF